MLTDVKPIAPTMVVSKTSLSDLHLESTLAELSLYDFQVDIDEIGWVIAQVFESHSLIPGAILLDGPHFAGMISRRRFLEHISRPYGRELFLRRSLRSLYRFAHTDVLLFHHTNLIVDAARQALRRSPELLYEPVVVELDRQTYRLLDVHQLLIAQSYIHELATNLIRQQTQAQLIQTEKMASLGQMVAGVAHEIRNPITAITGNVNCLSNYTQDLLDLMMVYDTELTDSQKIENKKEEIDWCFLQQDLPDILQSMKAAADRLSHLVNGLHSFSHMDGAKKREADLHQCIDSTLLILKNRLKTGIKVIKKYDNLPPINCYSGQLSQVIMNLLANALDALTEYETQHKKEYPQWEPTIEIITEIMQIDKSEWVSICIADNGPGIPLEIQQKIFDNFFTTKPVGKGTGLGLAISKQIVTEKHDGKLHLQSCPGKGTKFEILLPL